jgi:soluble lytic murein transglycosylase-like protein
VAGKGPLLMETPVTKLRQVESPKPSMSNVTKNPNKVLYVMSSAIMLLVVLCALLTMWYFHSKTKYLENEFEIKLAETRISINNNVSEQVIFLKIMVLNDQTNVELAREIAKSVYKWARVYDRDPDLMLALIKIESNFNPKAISSAGAEGLTQIMPFWYEIFKEPPGTFKNINKSIEYGHRILALYESQYGNVEMALIAYNRGHHRIENDLTKGKNPSNGYASKVLKVYNKMKELNIGS